MRCPICENIPLVEFHNPLEYMMAVNAAENMLRQGNIEMIYQTCPLDEVMDKDGKFYSGRIFHLFRINAQYDSFNVITTVLFEKRNQIFSSVFIIVILMFASSIGMYSAEHEAQPDVFKNSFSGLWWSMSTLLTVGYGDIYPVTAIGRIMAICIAFLGVGVVAIPTGIISAGFVEQYSKKAHSDSILHDIEKIGEIPVNTGSELIGMTVDEIQNEFETRIYLIFRNGLSIIAADNVVIQEKDILVVHSFKVVKK